LEVEAQRSPGFSRSSFMATHIEHPESRHSKPAATKIRSRPSASAWITLEGPAMSTEGYVALGFGILFSIVVGCGLMALMFYSSRHGYDDQAGGSVDDRP